MEFYEYLLRWRDEEGREHLTLRTSSGGSAEAAAEFASARPEVSRSSIEVRSLGIADAPQWARFQLSPLFKAVAF